ncbi:hypothetical protein GCM10027162_57950 [Streptomyces incanus]
MARNARFDDEQVVFDEDFVFYGVPENPAGTVRILIDGPARQTIAIDFASLPPASRKVAAAAAVGKETTWGARPPQAAPPAKTAPHSSGTSRSTHSVTNDSTVRRHQGKRCPGGAPGGPKDGVGDEGYGQADGLGLLLVSRHAPPLLPGRSRSVGRSASSPTVNR